MGHWKRFAACAAGVVVALGGFSTGEALGSVPNYQLVGSFSAPDGRWDILPDGRLISIGGTNGSEIFVQNSVNGSGYSVAGSLSTLGGINSFGASFLRVSPGGGTVAVGDGNFDASASVYTFTLSDLGGSTPTQRIVSPNFDGVFLDDGTLFVTGSNPTTFANGVYRLNLTTNTSTLVVDDFGGASGGIATDGAYLYTGNGFDLVDGGSVTGEVRAVLLSSVDGTGPLVSFESEMIPVARALSAGSLGFDGFGNFLIGGGDGFSGGEADFAGVIAGSRIADALAGLGFTPGVDLALSPDPAFADFYSIRFNHATGELLVAANGTVYRYIPAPGTGAVALLGCLVAGRRRRRGA
ncbi:MAG: hypothetical protein EA380_04075 [Phycisphaeraceae bacterium]|nr:MAG: hypothetical protein EA380_04075 [Phycisphaeraceae bacterium]